MSLEQVNDLKGKLACLNDRICQLNKKLISYDKIMAKKDDLQAQYSKLRQWCEEVGIKNRKVKEKLMKSLDCQIEKLKHAETAACELRAKNDELLDDDECITERLNTLKKNEQRLVIEMKDLETKKKCIEKELSNYKAKVQDKIHIIERLKNALKCKEDENFDMQRQLEDYKTKRNQLQETCRNLEMDIECMKEEMENANCQVKQLEIKLKLERESEENELEIMNQKLRDIELKLKETKRTLDDERCKLKKLEACVLEFRDSHQRSSCEMENKIKLLKKANCEKDDKLSCFKNKIMEKQLKNEYMAKEVKSKMTEVHTNECLLEKMKHSTQVIEQLKGEKYEQLEKEKNLMVCDLKNKTQKIAQLERQVSIFKDQFKAEEAKESSKYELSCPPKCNLPQSCSLNSSMPTTTLKCSENLGKKCDSSNNRTINELDKLFCELEKIEENTKNCYKRSTCYM